MNRRPWVGLGLSVVFHASLLALVVLAVWRGESLPALVVDLREDFIAGAASVRSLVRETLPSRAASPAAVPRAGQGKSAASPPQPAAAPPVAASPQPIAPAPEVAAAPPAEAHPPAPEPSLAPPALIPAAPPRAPSPPVVVAELPSRGPASALPPPSAGSRETLLLPSPPVSGSGSATRSATTESPASVSAAAGPSQASAVTASVARAGNGGVTGPPAPRSADGLAGRREGASASGPVVVTALPGSGSGVGAEYGPYLSAFRQLIQQSLRYPMSARRRGVSGTVSVEILVLENGSIGGVTLLASSSHAVLDEAALDTIRSLPRMPLPPELPARSLRIRVPVVFEMRER